MKCKSMPTNCRWRKTSKLPLWMRWHRVASPMWVGSIFSRGIFSKFHTQKYSAFFLQLNNIGRTLSTQTLRDCYQTNKFTFSDAIGTARNETLQCMKDKYDEVNEIVDNGRMNITNAVANVQNVAEMIGVCNKLTIMYPSLAGLVAKGACLNAVGKQIFILHKSDAHASNFIWFRLYWPFNRTRFCCRSIWPSERLRYVIHWVACKRISPGVDWELCKAFRSRVLRRPEPLPSASISRPATAVDNLGPNGKWTVSNGAFNGSQRDWKMCIFKGDLLTEHPTALDDGILNGTCNA